MHLLKLWSRQAQSSSTNLKLTWLRPGITLFLPENKQRAAANAHWRPESLILGNRVLIQETSSANSKLFLKFEGPHKITKLAGDNAYEVDLPVGYDVHKVVNISKLKRYFWMRQLVKDMSNLILIAWSRSLSLTLFRNIKHQKRGSGSQLISHSSPVKKSKPKWDGK